MPPVELQRAIVRVERLEDLAWAELGSELGSGLGLGIGFGFGFGLGLGIGLA